jgi:hypothetical protein
MSFGFARMTACVGGGEKELRHEPAAGSSFLITLARLAYLGVLLQEAR